MLSIVLNLDQNVGTRLNAIRKVAITHFPKSHTTDSIDLHSKIFLFSLKSFMVWTISSNIFFT